MTQVRLIVLPDSMKSSFVPRIEVRGSESDVTQVGLLILGFFCTSKLLVKWRYLLVKPEQCSKKDLV